VSNNDEDMKRTFINWGNLSDREILERPEYYLDKWLDIGVNQNTKPRLTKSTFMKFMKLYLNDNFYDDLKLTPFGEALKFYLNNNFVDKVTILTHTFNENLESKKNFLLTHFNNEKVSIEFIGHNIKKHKFINDNKIEYDLFVDDRLDTVLEVIENTNSDNKEFLMPEMGYNKINSKHEKILQDFFKSKKIRFAKYSNIL
jgi:hypothetical protein